MPEILTRVEEGDEMESNKFSDFFVEQMKDAEFAAAYSQISDTEDRLLYARLRDCVVEATRGWRMELRRVGATSFSIEQKLELLQTANMSLRAAVDALIEFESQHGITK